MVHGSGKLFFLCHHDLTKYDQITKARYEPLWNAKDGEHVIEREEWRKLRSDDQDNRTLSR